MSAWEGLEFELSRLHSYFCNDPDGDAITEYGSGRIFRDRIDILSRKADSYFVGHCSQTKEARFSEIVRVATHLSGTRNDIAHGIVMDVSGIQHFVQTIKLIEKGIPQYLLVPPIHTIRKHINGLPEYALNSKQLKLFAKTTIDFFQSVAQFRKSL
ncbi:hypothetical protein [Hartmannibacter diazotrophicus]|uniref:hypothetical protein n=1 Tax=Hartmannibacter diazotrophicus TaxID=1482074 RepID=UPI0012FE6056|nr:hypothetical protein [Hartmannibacter diazotrophicus]